MNHFFALPMPSAIQEELAKLAEEWRRLPVGQASWYAPADYHITLKFLGNLDPSGQAELVDAALPVAAQTEPFVVDLNSPAGGFPNLRGPRVLWAGVRESEPMADLAGAIDQAMAALGFAKERRRFTPHITLARCKRSPLSTLRERGPGGEGRQRMRAWPLPGEHQFPLFTADRFNLMETRSQKDRQTDKNTQKPRYNIVRTFPFGVIEKIR